MLNPVSEFNCELFVNMLNIGVGGAQYERRDFTPKP